MRRSWWIAVWLVGLWSVLPILAACGSGSSANEATSTTPVEIASASPTPTPSPTPQATPTLTADQLATYKPNELGQILVLEFHGFVEDPHDYDTSPEKFRALLQRLYDEGFYVIPIADYINDEIKAPPGKRPVVLTFDDGVASQFRYLVNADGTKTIDPNCAVGILEDFFGQHPDFGRGGLFSILPNAPFAWPGEPDQLPFTKEKMEFLVEHGYAFGNHTVNHVNLHELSNDEIMKELAGAVDAIRSYVPDARVDVIAVPFGMYPPHGDTTLFEGFDYQGQHYAFTGALMVGANPAPSPEHKEFDPYWIPRIQATDDELEKWFDFVKNNPGIMYVSDGNPETVTIPNDVPNALAGAFDEAKAMGKTVIHY